MTVTGGAGHWGGLKVAIFDDVVAARGETFHIPGLDVDVYAHADEAEVHCVANDYDVVLMDFSMGRGRRTGSEAITATRGAGYHGRIIAISSDPAANAAMIAAGANESLAKKAHVRSFLVHLGAEAEPQAAP